MHFWIPNQRGFVAMFGGGAVKFVRMGRRGALVGFSTSRLAGEHPGTPTLPVALAFSAGFMPTRPVLSKDSFTQIGPAAFITELIF